MRTLPAAGMRPVSAFLSALMAVAALVGWSGPVRAQRVPFDLPYVIEDACPGECCGYGTWTAETPITVFRSRGNTSRPYFRIRPGESFEALGGSVLVLRPGIVVVEDTVPAYERSPKGLGFLPGDTVYVLDYVGEGHLHVWYEGEEVGVTSFWQDTTRWWGDVPRWSKGRLVQRGQNSWWVHVRTEEGETGWFEFDSEVDVRGNDLCSAMGSGTSRGIATTRGEMTGDVGLVTPGEGLARHRFTPHDGAGGLNRVRGQRASGTGQFANNLPNSAK